MMLLHIRGFSQKILLVDFLKSSSGLSGDMAEVGSLVKIYGIFELLSAFRAYVRRSSRFGRTSLENVQVKKTACFKYLRF